MANRYEVLCVNKTNTELLHDKISHIGGRNREGGKWRISQEKAIDGILSGEMEFYISHRGQSLKVVVAGAYKKKYLKCETDEEIPAILLGLPDC